MAVEVYRVMSVNQVAVNVIYSCLGIEMFKTLSVHFIDWWLCRSHSATQPLCQSGWCSHSATQPEWLEQPLVSFRFTHLTHRMQASHRLLQHLWPQVLPQVSGCATQCHVVIWRAMTCSILLNWEPCPGPTVAVPLARTNTVGPDDKQHNVEPPDQSSTLVSMFFATAAKVRICNCWACKVALLPRPGYCEWTVLLSASNSLLWGAHGSIFARTFWCPVTRLHHTKPILNHKVCITWNCMIPQFCLSLFLSLSLYVVYI